MRAEIISVGTELLLGDIVNTNAQFLAQRLAALGFSVFHQQVVGDNPARLAEAVRTAKQRSDVLVFTGGLGPTDDDLTKQTVAAEFGDVLVQDEEEMRRLQSYFTQRGFPITQNNFKQAMVPKRGRKLPNANGTAPGAYFEQDGKIAILMPGPPTEMKAMFRSEVRPILEKMQDATIRSHTLHVFGMGESTLEERVYDLLNNENPTAALYAKTGEVHVRITARAQSEAEAESLCEAHAERFRRQLGDLIYSENGDDLEAATVHALAQKGQSVATAESCTGGLLSQRITSVPGASGVFGFGLCSYANDTKQRILGVSGDTLERHGAVSSQVAAEMAFGAAKVGQAAYGVGITGIAGPDGGTPEKPVGLVYIAAGMGGQVWVKKQLFSGRGRPFVRWLATQHALDMVRRLALGRPIADAKQFEEGTPADFEAAP